jgi:ABC-type phosphate transport system substrate-binding protein
VRTIGARLSFCAVVLVLSLAVAIAPAHADTTIEGAGSSFPQLEIEQWRSDVSKKPYNINVNYVSSGSTFGRTQYIQGGVDFGVSDIAFQPDEIGQAANRPYTYVTISAGGVGFMYNLRDATGKRIGFPASNGGTGTDLKLTPRTVCRLFSEPNMMWNDAELQADNPDIQLPAERVQPVFRADGSGTGFVVQEYCIATAKDVWDAFVQYVANTPVLRTGVEGDPFLAGKPSSKWPVFAGQSAFASDGVANVVATDTSGKNGITYVEAGFAEVRGFPNALVKNAAGIFHYPESVNVNRALTHAKRNDDATVTLDYVTPDPDAYFPSSYSYAIVPTSGISTEKGAALASFLNYAVTIGQEKADLLGYAPLSLEIVDISLNEIVKIPGAPPKPQVVTFDPDSGGGGGGIGGGGSGGGGGGGSGGGTTIEGGAVNGDGGTGQQGGGGGSSTRQGGTSATTVAPVVTTPSGAVVSGPGGGGASGGDLAAPNANNGGALSAVAATTTPPSNDDVLIALLQGAAIAAAGVAIAWRWRRRLVGS